MELPAGIEPASPDYRSGAFPLSYGSVAPAFSALKVSWGRQPVLSVQDCAASLSVVSQLLSVCVPSGWLRMGATQQRARLSGLSSVADFPLCHLHLRRRNRARLSGVSCAVFRIVTVRC